MGGLFKAPKPPAPPPPAQTPNFRSEVSGVERIVTKGADGKETIIERKLPLSAEEQALENQYRELETRNLARLTQLSETASALDIPEFQNDILAFREQQRFQLEQTADFLADTQEEALARRGLADSTSATEQRVQTEKLLQQEAQEADDRTRLFAEGLKQTEMAEAQNLFNIGANRASINFANALAGAGAANQAALGQFQATNQAQQAMFANQMAAFNSAQQSRAARNQSLMGLAALGTFAAGPSGFGLFGTSGAAGAAAPIALPKLPGA